MFRIKNYVCFAIRNECFFMFRVHLGSVLQVKMKVFHVPDTFGGRSAGKNDCFSMFRIHLGAVLLVKMNVFHVPDKIWGLFRRLLLHQKIRFGWGGGPNACLLTVWHPSFLVGAVT